jgi:hypothetical protein
MVAIRRHRMIIQTCPKVDNAVELRENGVVLLVFNNLP